jgi:hypothetical protein
MNTHGKGRIPEAWGRLLPLWAGFSGHNIENQILYCNQRGIGTEEAVGLIVNGYAKEVMQNLLMEFAVEAQKLLQISLEGSVG